ncbi:hypothetical protein CTI12_AA145670 [Artemisia annua]|uniref:Uncharacterized protein n=1 Tax=Artemisia annua TaxID=35608 RepID=A0A2U1PJB2_ARTAN|nr:hypothetical protein CTI12_AA145670 [Artemisia annua]
MYPPSCNNNGNPFVTLNSYNNNRDLLKSPQEDFCPTSSSSFQLCSPPCITLEDGMVLSELLQQENLFCDDDGITDYTNHNTNNNVVHQEFSNLHSDMKKCSNKNGDDDGLNKPKSQRRATKKDRHSKINTAQGPRDRRMRLSIDVAKKFFKLQDLLGFDKASKTVEWLLMKSKSNIQELSSLMNFSNSASGNSNDQSMENSSSKNSDKEKKKAIKGVRKSSYLLRPLAKETREMARKRARERTVERSSKFGCVGGGDDQFLELAPCLDQSMNRGLNCLGSWTTDQPEQPRSHCQFMNRGLNCLGSWTTDQPEQPRSHCQFTGNCSPYWLFNHSQAGVLPQEHHQLNDFHILGNLWEGFN